MYSQNQEESYILNFFKGTKGKLLDIGANDGKTFSNSLALIEQGWEADLVEPNPEAFKLLKNLHYGNERVIVWQCAVSDFTGKSNILLSTDERNPHDKGLVSTLYEGETTRWKDNPFVDYSFTPAVVDVLHARTFSHAYDFITIDCEGAETKIIPHLDYSNCKMICIEWNSKPELFKIYSDYLEGFRLYHKNAENLIYVK